MPSVETRNAFSKVDVITKTPPPKVIFAQLSSTVSGKNIGCQLTKSCEMYPLAVGYLSSSITTNSPLP